MRGSKILRAYPVPINSGDLDKIKVTHVSGSKSSGSGADGKDGKDGVSCTHKWNGTVLTITSASGTSSADLKGAPGKNGADGKPGRDGLPGKDGVDGYTPVKGVDYFTDTEKQEIVNSVLAGLSSEVWTFTLESGSTTTKTVVVK